MPDLPRSHLLAYALAAVLVLAVGARQVAHSRGVGGAAAAAVGADTTPAPLALAGGAEGGKRLVVHVAGAVRRPGVYRMPEGARVDDAVRRAGGAKRRADLTQVNLAAEVEDGRQILVPLKARVAGTGGGEAVGAGTATAGAAAVPGVPLSLNTATLEQLDTLSGIGPATAQKILDYRDEHDGFSDVEELAEVPGIGDVRLAALRELVRP